ncbi:zf-CCHC domain-containing protein, partial [Tanacetum coccineum]
MTRSSTKELFTPFKDPKREFQSSRKHFKTLSLDESISPDFDLFSDQEEYSEEEELHDNTFSGSDHEHANEHIEKVLEIMDLFHIPNITIDQVMLRAFLISLTRATSHWLRNKPSSSITTWEDLKMKFLSKYCPPARTVKKMTRSTETSDGLAAIQVQLNNLGREIKKGNEKVYDAQVGCERCKGPYYTKDCTLKEEGKTLKEAYYTQFGAPFQGGGYRATAPTQGELQFDQRNEQGKEESYEPQFSKAYSYGASNNSIPKKEKDLGIFTLPCVINNVCFNNALADLGASVSVIPLSTYLNLGLGELAHTKLTVELADRTIKYPKGIAKNVLVGIGKFVFPVDFIILDLLEDIKVPLILERPLLSTAHAKIDVFKRKITLRVGEEKINFKSVKPTTPPIDPPKTLDESRGWRIHKYIEGQSMRRPPLFESDHFIYWKNRFETYVKAKDLDLWHIISNGDFPPLAKNEVTQILEVVPFKEQSDDLKKKLAKNNEAKMVLYNALPKKEYERIFMCKTAKDIWQSLLITHQGNSQVKDNKIDLLVQQYEQFTILEEESIDSGFARFNTIITSLKALDEGFSSKNYVRKFLRALHPKWRAKVTAIEESKDLSSLALDELIGNLKVHEVVMEKDSISEIKLGKKGRVKTLKSSYKKGKFLLGNQEKKRINSNKKDEKKKEWTRKCFRCGDPNHLIGDCPKPSRNKDQKAFIRGSWSDSENDAENKTNDETCLMAQSSNEFLIEDEAAAAAGRHLWFMMIIGFLVSSCNLVTTTKCKDLVIPVLCQTKVSAARVKRSFVLMLLASKVFNAAYS